MPQTNIHGYEGAILDGNVAITEPNIPISRKIFNGLVGTVVLLVGLMVVLFIVLWKAR